MIVKDFVNQTEDQFVFPDLIHIDYFQKYRRGYYASRENGLLNIHRNYVNLLLYLNDIHEYNEQHAKSFAKRLQSNKKDWKNCEAIFSEVIVYRSYIRSVYEGLIKKIELDESESDIIIERLDGIKAYLEIFCIMPNFPIPDPDKIVVIDVKTHTQKELASVRQKLLRKIDKQRQFTKQRENFAVIELNDVSIAGDFTVLSSLSSGYEERINKETMESISEGYNWEDSIFKDPRTKFLKGIIYFNLGDYNSRKCLVNPYFK